MARVTLHEYCEEARELINARTYDEAIAICRHILQRYPKHIRTYQILGEACLEKRELEEATDIFKRLLDHADPENFVAYAGLGVLSEEKGQFAEAIWYMERAFELVPNNDDIRNALRRLYGKRDGTEPTRIKLNKAALARLYARGGQYRQAIEEFRSLLELEANRGRMDLKVSLAETLWRDGRREEAAELAREILQTVTDCLKAILLLGAIQIEKGRTDEGLATLEKARGLDPENRVAQALFGEQSPLPPNIVKIPRIEKGPAAEAVSAEQAEAKAVPAAVSEPPPSTGETLEKESVPLQTPEAVLEPVASVGEEVVAEREPTLDEMPEVEVVPAEATEAIALTEGETPEAVSVEVCEPTIPSTAEAEMPMPVKEVSPEEAPLASATATAAMPLSDVARYKLHLEQMPKDEETRLLLARAYRDQEQIKLALEQYNTLIRAKSNILTEVISDVETIVASRPDNLEGHELLADLYARNGQLQEAVDRYRWILRKLETKPA